jgi:peptidoglycan hydrolase-like protein with peptidoglycan-binding domain
MMILYNLFLGQQPLDEQSLAALQSGATRMTVSAPGKQSRTVTLKYEEIVEDVQRELLALGHFQGLVDGVNGPQTKRAVELYQRQAGIDVTGDVTRALLDHIRYTRKLAQAAEFTGSLAPESKPVTMPSAAAPNATVLKLQERLGRLGYDPGVRSGRLDEETVSVILKFEMDHNLAMDGTVTEELLAAVAAVERQRAAQ